MVTENVNDEILFYESCELSKLDTIVRYVNYLKTRIGLNVVTTKNTTHYDKKGNKCELQKIDIDEYTKNLDSIIYHSPWKKLKNFHKITKINEYIDSLAYNKNIDPKIINKNKENIKNELAKGMESKKFLKNKNEIIYDEKNAIIKSIDCLVYDNKSKLYYIEWE